MQARRLAALAAALAAMLGPAIARADFVNGSFETGTYTFDGNGADSLAPGSTAITGWTTFGAELAVIQNANSFGVTTPFGTKFLDLTGYHDSTPYGGIQQTVATVAGQTYTVTLDLGVNSSVGFGGPVSVLVTAGTSSGILTANPSGNGDIWTPETFSFVAGAGTTTTVMIQGTASANGHYLGLDNVSINANPVPEPAGVALLGLGAVTLAGYVRRRATARRG